MSEIYAHNLITPSGFQTNSQRLLMEKLKEDFRKIYGEGVELEPNTPDGQLIGIFTQMICDQTEMIKNMFAGLFPSTAEGVFLDYNLDLLGLKRKNGECAKVKINVSFEGVKNLEAAKFIIQIQGVKFYNDDEIQKTGPYSFTAFEDGAMQFAPSEHVDIVTSVDGVSAKFEDTIYSGSEFESDYDFRERHRNLVETRDDSASYIEARLLQIDHVEDCKVYEKARTGKIYLGDLPSNCIYAVLKPANFDKEKVLGELYALKPGGIECYVKNKTEAENEGRLKKFGEGEIEIGFDLASYEYIEKENYTLNFHSKGNKEPIPERDVRLVLEKMQFKIRQDVFVSEVEKFVVSRMPGWYAGTGNNIQGSSILEGKITTIYKFKKVEQHEP
jgi:uncharacterized membrane protein